MDAQDNPARVLVEALPYIQQFAGKVIVIKFGGNAMTDEELKHDFARDVVLLKQVGINPIVVHGGGPQIGSLLKRLGIESQFVRGLRVTDDETMDVVEMVLVGKVNKEIVALMNKVGGRSVGLSGKDGGLIRASKLSLAVRSEGNTVPELIDLGRVGQVEEVNPAMLDTLDLGGFIPIIAPVGVDETGTALNINADSVAGKIAASMGAAKLILLTDVTGVLDDDGELIHSMSAKRARRMMSSGDIDGGMIPKVECCLDALSEGVGKAHIIDGRVSHAVLLELLTDAGVGTEILLSPDQG